MSLASSVAGLTVPNADATFAALIANPGDEVCDAEGKVVRVRVQATYRERSWMIGFQTTATLADVRARLASLIASADAEIALRELEGAEV
jgi:hypothetical protein